VRFGYSNQGMTFEKQNHPAQLDLCPRLEAPKTNKEKQRDYRARQAKLGRKGVLLYLTSDERFHLERVLEEMRETGGTPAAMRNSRGQFYHLDN